MWDSIYAKMAKGEIPHSKRFYDQRGFGEITIVSPTQQQTDIAKSNLKREMKQNMTENTLPVIVIKKRKTNVQKKKTKRKKSEKKKKTKKNVKRKRKY